MPSVIAITISNNTVSDIQINIIKISSLGAHLMIYITRCTALIFQATINSKAAIADSGI